MSYSDNEPTVAAMERVIKQRDEAKAENARLREKLTELDTDFDDMRADRNRMREENKRVGNRYSEVSVENAKLREENARNIKARIEARNERDRLREELEQTQRQDTTNGRGEYVSHGTFQRMAEEMLVLKAELARLNKDLDRWLEYEKDIEAELARLCGQLNRTSKYVDQLREELTDAGMAAKEQEAENARLREENKQLLLTKAGAFMAQMEYAEENARLREENATFSEQESRLREALADERTVRIDAEQDVAEMREALNIIRIRTGEKLVRDIAKHALKKTT